MIMDAKLKSKMKLYNFYYKNDGERYIYFFNCP